MSAINTSLFKKEPSAPRAPSTKPSRNPFRALFAKKTEPTAAPIAPSRSYTVETFPQHVEQALKSAPPLKIERTTLGLTDDMIEQDMVRLGKTPTVQFSEGSKIASPAEVQANDALAFVLSGSAMRHINTCIAKAFPDHIIQLKLKNLSPIDFTYPNRCIATYTFSVKPGKSGPSGFQKDPVQYTMQIQVLMKREVARTASSTSTAWMVNSMDLLSTMPKYSESDLDDLLMHFDPAPAPVYK